MSESVASKVEQLGTGMGNPMEYAKDQLNDLLEQASQGEKNSERMKNLLRGWETETEDFVKNNGSIDWEAVKKNLEWGQKMALLASAYLGDVLPGLFGVLKSEKVEFSTFEEALHRLKSTGASCQKIGNNLIYPRPTKGAMGALNLIGSLSQFSDKDDEGKQVLRIVEGSTFVVPKAASAERTLFSKGALMPRLVDELRAKGITLNLLTPGETVPTADAKSINVIYAPAQGLPKSGGQVDVGALKIFKEVFDRGGSQSAQWYTPDLVAALLWMDALKKGDAGYTVEKAIADAGADPGLVTELQTIQLEDLN